MEEEILTVPTVKGKKGGADVYHAFTVYACDVNPPLQKLVSVRTDGTLAIVSSRNGPVGLRRRANRCHFPSHTAVLFTKKLRVVSRKHMKVVAKIIYPAVSTSLKHRLYEAFLEFVESEFSDLTPHTEIRWLNMSKVVSNNMELIPQNQVILEPINEKYEQLTNPCWLLDLATLTHLTLKFNDLNLEIQGKDENATETLFHQEPSNKN
jgi:hypothetical protein